MPLVACSALTKAGIVDEACALSFNPVFLAKTCMAL
jgi:hypothetical protein